MPLGLQPGFDNGQHLETVGQHLEVGARFNIAETQQNITFFDGIRLIHQNFGHDAAFKVLDDLAVTLQRDRAGGDNCAVELGNGSPAAKDAKGQKNDRIAQNSDGAWIGFVRHGFCFP